MMKEKNLNDGAMILVVDDDDTFRNLLCQFLEKHGYATRVAKDGHEALKVFEEKCPELVIMDADMPGMDGFTACALLTSSPGGKDIPIIMATGFQDESSVDRAYDAGAVDYVTKPIHWAVLRNRIKNIITLNRSRENLQLAQEAQKQAEKKLALTRKMETVNLMAAGVAHDLNNILSGIVSYPELLLLKLPAESELRRPLEVIKESGQKAALVVADLLTVARSAASTKESNDLHSIIIEYLNSSDYEQTKQLFPELLCQHEFSAQDSIIACCPLHIKKCLINLVNNAAEAVADDGVILLSTTKHFVDESFSIEHNIKKGEYIVLSVQDSRSAISSHDLEHIFEPFHSKKKMGLSGTGLELTIVWNITREHGGTTDVDSRSEGTAFHLYFPLVIKQEESAPSEDDSNASIQGKGEHILVVDDEAHIREIATRILTSHGYETAAVCSGEDAIEYIKKTPVDLLLLDMLMKPGINGKTTYEKILTFFPGLKAIVSSGFSETSDTEAILKLGVGDFLKKPYSVTQLCLAVRKELDR